MSILAIDHVQLAIPRGGEPLARAFYGGVLGFGEIPKPAELAGRGGAWFRSGAVQLHVGVETDFRPAVKAHPALLVDDLAAILARARAAGARIAEDAPLPGHARAFVFDPFGNRIELMQARSA